MRASVAVITGIAFGVALGIAPLPELAFAGDGNVARKATAKPFALYHSIGAEKLVVRSTQHNLVTEEANPIARNRAIVREALVSPFEAGLAADR